MNTWFTPTLLFIFLNLMIATILFTSNLPNNLNKPSTQNKLLTSSPSILHRLKSFTLHTSQHNHPSPPTIHQQPPPPQEQEQDALETAATQYVFSHPFTEEQDL
ncbi:hypothetical protein QVD17_16297 [Tagetes erecta]|uniref:DUF4408 domain-containing protein n=1 Tax=Tagetes erecta TaxID=13708 RepID=A0AAD8P0D7_TARER|nr:hypothetical protein QVD17_16297 [Tagetes erecta]